MLGAGRCGFLLLCYCVAIFAAVPPPQHPFYPCIAFLCNLRDIFARIALPIAVTSPITPDMIVATGH